MPDDPDRPELLTHVSTEPQAAMLVAFLDAEGVEAVAEGVLTSAFLAEAPGRVRIVVHHRDLDRARQLLAQYLSQRSDIDWAQVDTEEPRDS